MSVNLSAAVERLSAAGAEAKPEEARAVVAELFAASQTGEYGADVILVAQPSGDPRTQLGHDFVINSRRSLVHHQQGHKVFSHLASNCAESGLT